MSENLPLTKKTIPLPYITLHRKEALFLFLLFLGSLFTFWQFGIDWQHITPDKSMQTYIAQEITRGHTPYLSVIFPKTPLTPLLSALAIFLGDGLNLPDIISVRILFLVLGSLGVVFTFLVAKIISPDFWPRLASAFTLLGFGLWGIHAATGAEPKILVTLLGLITIWALAGKRWFWAGLTASLAFLTWQPAAIYQILALAMPFGSIRGERRQALLSAIIGLILPLALISLYLLASGALLPAFRQTILSQFAYLAEGGGGWTAGSGVGRFLEISGDFLALRPRGWGGESWLAILGLIGWLGLTFQALSSLRRPVSSSNPWLLIVSGLFWLIFSLRDIDGLVDLVPLLPYLAVGVGWLVRQTISFIRKLSLSQTNSDIANRYLPILANIVILAYGLQDIPLDKSLYPVTLQDQTVKASLLDSYLGSNGQVQAIGDLSLLVLSERQNLTPLIHLGPKHYNLLLNEPGGLEAILDRIASEKPEVMILQRVWDYAWAEPFFKLAVGEIPYPYRANFGEEIQLLGYGVNPSNLHPGSEMPLTLYLSATALAREDYRLKIKLLAPTGEVHGQHIFDHFPGEGQSPLWEIGAVVKQIGTVPIPSWFPAPAAAQLQLAFYPEGVDEPLPILSIEGDELGSSITFPPFRVIPISTPPLAVPNKLDFQVGDYFRLAGYDCTTPASGESVELALYWQSIAATTGDYQVFVHLIDSQGNIIAQGDSAPRQGYYPTSLWLPEEIVPDTHPLPVPRSFSPDEYQFRVGMYRLDTLERLPVFDENGGRQANDEIMLQGVCSG
ncbi:MAG: hypothetical protein HYX86_05095 [Chloroflexi bacterium]|nr:hypothetical protein [Chloroflexota bacterium]